MLIVEPDFARRIDLPGNGPCPRPVDIDRGTTHFDKLLSLRVYSFASGAVIDGEAEEDEVFVVLMRGAAEVAVTEAGTRADPFALDTDGGSRAVYLPPHAGYRLTAPTDCDIAYARVQPPVPQLNRARAFAPAGGRLDVAAYAAGMDLALRSVPAGETLSLADREGGLPERFVHVRSDDGGVATIEDMRLTNWKSVALGDGEAATIESTEGSLDVLTITAATR